VTNTVYTNMIIEDNPEECARARVGEHS